MVAAGQVWPMEFRVVRPGGEVRFLRSDGIFRVDDYGKPLRCVGVHQDITEAKRAEAARRQAEERLAEMEVQLRHAARLATLGALTAGIAHEVNQPLCAILNFAQACRNLASQEAPDLSLICQWSEAIAAAASRSGDIVRRMGGFSRRSPAEYREVSVRELVDDATMMVRFEAQRAKVEILQQLQDKELTIAVHPIQIHQVLVNLLRNAIEAFHDEGPSQRQVVVQVEAIAEEVRVRVVDNGPGLGNTDPKDLFAPFFTTKPTGLGMGLSISRTIVEEHRGRIWATRNEQGGLTVTFTLPIQCGGIHGDTDQNGIRG